MEPGSALGLHPQGDGVLLVPIPKAESLAGIARGAETSDYRDRDDRV